MVIVVDGELFICFKILLFDFVIILRLETINHHFILEASFETIYFLFSTVI